MKKSLLAVAAIGAFASAAQAQSSVTVYGILDVGFAGNSSRVPQVSAPTGTNNATATTFGYKTNATSFGNSQESTSRLGFKGTEDLGGGTSAFFTIEMQLAPSADNNFTNMTNRQSFVGLGKKGLGQAAVGTQYTPVHMAVGATDPGQANNVHGNLIYAVNTGTVNAGQATSYTVRANNALTVATDKFAGFSANAIYSNNMANRTQTATAYTSTAATNGGNTNSQAWGIGANYTWNKLYAAAAYQVLKNESDMVAGAYATLTAASATVGTNVPAINGTSNQSYGAVTYDFGILKAYAQYLNNKTTSNIASNQYAKRSAQQLGVRGFITPSIEGWASIGNGRISANGINQPTANFTGWQLGTNYLLSKRTNLYAIYGMSQSSNVTSVVPASGYAVNGSAANSAYAVGVRHTF